MFKYSTLKFYEIYSKSINLFFVLFVYLLNAKSRVIFYYLINRSINYEYKYIYY